MSTWEPGEDAAMLWSAIESTSGTRNTEKVIWMLEGVRELLDVNPLDVPVGDLIGKIQSLREMREAISS